MTRMIERWFPCQEVSDNSSSGWGSGNSERGLFTWGEWAAALATEIKRAQSAGDPDTGETYYAHWLAALEKLVAEKGVTTSEILHRTRDAWDHACDRTPHGQPIVLMAADFQN